MSVNSDLNTSHKTNAILRSNLKVFLAPNETQVRGSFNHDLTFSDADMVDFAIARKTVMGIWVNENNAISDLIDGFFEDGFKGTGAELVEEINKSYFLKKEALLMKERQRVDAQITASINTLGLFKEKLCKSTATSLRYNVGDAIKRGSSDGLYRNDIAFLDKKVSHLLSDEETLKLENLKIFYNALDDSQNPDSFEILKQFCKKED